MSYPVRRSTPVRLTSRAPALSSLAPTSPHGTGTARGSGFLFTKGNFLDYANVYRYDFATSAATPLTQFTDEFAIDVSVSPDGQWIVFERSETNEFTAGDLWIMRWDGTEMRLLVQNGLRPSWSQHALPPPLIPRNYIPLVLR